jgi:hypothetical protein
MHRDPFESALDTALDAVSLSRLKCHEQEPGMILQKHQARQ